MFHMLGITAAKTMEYEKRRKEEEAAYTLLQETCEKFKDANISLNNRVDELTDALVMEKERSSDYRKIIDSYQKQFQEVVKENDEMRTTINKEVARLTTINGDLRDTLHDLCRMTNTGDYFSLLGKVKDMVEEQHRSEPVNMRNSLITYKTAEDGSICSVNIELS